jgi:predicted RNA-binding protein with PIN domain
MRGWMNIIIDAYNLIKQIYKKNFITDHEKETIIKKLIQYSRLKGHTFTIVFDGGSSWWIQKEKYNSVEVIWPGQTKSADDYIKLLIEDTKNNSHQLLVSSDHELITIANSYDIPAIESVYFWQFVLIAIQEKQEEKILYKEEIKKLSKSIDESVDEIMHEFSHSISQKKDEGFLSKQRNTHEKMVSKNERRLYDIIKKL